MSAVVDEYVFVDEAGNRWSGPDLGALVSNMSELGVRDGELSSPDGSRTLRFCDELPRVLADDIRVQRHGKGRVRYAVCTSEDGGGVRVEGVVVVRSVCMFTEWVFDLVLEDSPF